MRPINALNLQATGESFARIGPTVKRTVPYKELGNLEKAILANTPLPASADVSPSQPPYFTEFTYSDLLGGMAVRTFSAEINARICRDTPNEIIPEKTVEHFMSGLVDKYCLVNSTKQYKRIVFLCGHNLFDRVVDSQMLFRLMDSDKSIVIKPHPITNDGLLRNLGNQFGYNRILEKDVSAFSLLDGCEEVITVTTSELSLMAVLLNKKFTDITQYMQNWAGQSAIPLYNALTYDNPRERLLTLLLGEYSGFVLPDMEHEKILEKIDKYCSKAMEMRRPFEMITSQRLSITIPRVMEVQRPPENKV
jgi:hypothetical protein